MSQLKLTPLGQDIFDRRYAYPSEKTWAERAKVIAHTAASVEKDEDKEKIEHKFYEVIGSGDLIPGGRIIYGSGRSKQNLLNCFSISPEDSVESIGKTIQDMYKISCGGGGIGFNFSLIRPKGDDIGKQKNSAPGSVSVMKMINEIGEHVRAGKSRRTALLAILNVTHPDLFEFLTVKLDHKQLNNFNISVGITDRFIEACKNDEDWYFTFNNRKYYIYDVLRHNPNKEKMFEKTSVKVLALSESDALARAAEQHKIYFDDFFTAARIQSIKAKDIWNSIWESSCNSGDPGIFNIDYVNKYTNVSYFSYIMSPNPCGEANLDNYGNCCLASVNLSNMIENGEFDWKKFARTTRAGVRFLDNILEVNHYPIPECREVGLKSRRIGLGVTGYDYALIKLGMSYGSEKAIEFTERLGAAFRDTCYLTSVALSKDKGSFPAFDRKKYLNEEFAKTLPARIRMLIKEHGIRNAILMAIAPTGTISMLMGVSTSIEPIFAPMYKRRYRDANVWKEVVVVDPLLEQFYKEGKSLENFLGAHKVTPEQHLATQAAWQKYIDQSLSKTINLPKDFEASSLSDIALDYVEYLKGLTIYRDSSKENAPLQPIPLTQENIDKYLKVEVVEVGIADGTICGISDGGCGA